LKLACVAFLELRWQGFADVVGSFLAAWWWVAAGRRQGRSSSPLRGCGGSIWTPPARHPGWPLWGRMRRCGRALAV